jgi:hypothetical protein
MPAAKSGVLLDSAYIANESAPLRKNYALFRNKTFSPIVVTFTDSAIPTSAQNNRVIVCVDGSPMHRGSCARGLTPKGVSSMMKSVPGLLAVALCIGTSASPVFAHAGGGNTSVFVMTNDKVKNEVLT